MLSAIPSLVVFGPEVVPTLAGLSQTKPYQGFESMTPRLAALGGSGTPRWTWIAAVVPSLLALATAWPWATGGNWPWPSLLVLGAFLGLSPLVDLRLKAAGLTPAGWMALRIPLSLGLGFLTILAGLV